MKFTYRSGHRPLDGYTIKRGVGQGGFGEVYFAVSDAGKEVALKLLRGHSEIELRGVSNCLNMKHPNLVHVYDLKEDERGDKWLVMEYVLGESLAAVLNRYPTGVPLSLVREWFSSLAKAIAYLHDRGVVHRDIKPANVFIEAGTLKVGDYGLCKAMTTSQRHTRTVGTVHYMAPEVSTGNYSQSIDVYACGIVLHEMLTGKLPFDGESDGEILMKHLTANPDLTGIPVAFQEILVKALDKNPVRRFTSVIEMAKAVDAACSPLGSPTLPHNYQPPVAMPVQPPPLSGVSTSLGFQSPLQPPPIPPPPVAKPVVKEQYPIARPVPPPSPRTRFTALLGGMLSAPLVAVAGLIPYALISHNHDWAVLTKFFLVTTGLTWAFLIGSGSADLRSPDTWARRIRMGVLGMLVGALIFWAEGWVTPRSAWATPAPESRAYMFGTMTLSPDAFTNGMHYLLYFGGLLAAGRWWRMTARDRVERFSLFPVVAACFWGGILLFLWPWNAGAPTSAFIPVVLAVVAAQLVSPWNPTARVISAKKLRLRTA